MGQITRSLSLEKPRLDERLALGVAVAAAAMGDAEPGEDRARGERRAVVGGDRQRLPNAIAWLVTYRSMTAIASLARQRRLISQPDDLARAAVDDRVEVDPAVLGDPVDVMSRCQSWAGRSTRKKPGRRRRGRVCGAG